MNIASTPLLARKALLAAIVKTRSGSKTAAVPHSTLANVIDLLSQMESEINGLRHPEAASHRENLEDQINQANMEFGVSAYHDRLIQLHLDGLKKQLNALPPAPYLRNTPAPVPMQAAAQAGMRFGADTTSKPF